MPCSASPATSCGATWPLTITLSWSWRIISLSSLALLRRGCRRSLRRRRRRHRSHCGRRGRAYRQTVEAQHRRDVRVVAGEAAVHLAIVERVAARQDQVAEALAVGTGQAAMVLEPVESVLGEHPRPWIGIIASRIAVTPDVQEIAGAVARRHVLGVEAAARQRLRLERVDVLPGGGRRQRVPVEVEPRRFEHLAKLIALVEGARRLDLVDETLRDRLSGPVLDRVVRQHLRIELPVLVELRGELDEVPGDAGA